MDAFDGSLGRLRRQRPMGQALGHGLEYMRSLGDVLAPPDPTATYLAQPSSEDAHGALIAWWAPLQQLLCFGLGWIRPDLGLARWRSMGFPVDDPILRAIHNWWGADRIVDYLAWAATSSAWEGYPERLAEVVPVRNRVAGRLAGDLDLSRRQAMADWKAVWGGGSDPMHLVDHALNPLSPNPRTIEARELRGPDHVLPNRLTLIAETYAGWYWLFTHYQPKRAGGRSIHTDIFVKPVGWLGEYRYSTETGLWFRGQHRWHMLGNR